MSIKKSTIEKGLALLKKYPTLLSKYGINTVKRKAAFLGQLSTENEDLKPVRESGYYSTIANARNTFKTPFKGKSDAFVQGYLKNSAKMLNYVYANRMGNGNEASGDGYKYRGGGNLQNTGKNQYEWLQNKTGIKFLENPDLILEEANSLIAALTFWEDSSINDYADLWDLDAVSDLVNIGSKTKAVGDANHFEKRKMYSNEFLKILKDEK